MTREARSYRTDDGYDVRMRGGEVLKRTFADLTDGVIPADLRPRFEALGERANSNDTA